MNKSDQIKHDLLIQNLGNVSSIWDTYRNSILGLYYSLLQKRHYEIKCTYISSIDKPINVIERETLMSEGRVNPINFHLPIYYAGHSNNISKVQQHLEKEIIIRIYQMGQSVPQNHANYNRYKESLKDPKPLSAKSQKALDKIIAFSDLHDNWDEQGAKEVSKEAIKRSIKWVHFLNEVGFEVFFTNPMPDGGISIQLRNNEKYKKIIVEFQPNGEGVYFKIFKNEVLFKEKINCFSVSIFKWLNE